MPVTHKWVDGEITDIKRCQILEKMRALARIDPKISRPASTISRAADICAHFTGTPSQGSADPHRRDQPAHIFFAFNKLTVNTINNQGNFFGMGWIKGSRFDIQEIMNGVTTPLPSASLHEIIVSDGL
jgi:hypothetical protein